MESNVNQYPIFALCPLCPCQWKCAWTPTLISHLCFQLALLFLLPGYKWNMWRNVPELLWDGHFITVIYPWINWENGSAFCADTWGRQSSTGLLSSQGALLFFLTSELMLSCQCQQSTEKNYTTPRNVKLQVDLCTPLIDSLGVPDLPHPKSVFSSKFPLTTGNEDQPRWKGMLQQKSLAWDFLLAF